MMDAHSVAIVEFQYLVDLLTNTQFYHFYHEHYYYYTVAGFANVAEKAGLEMVMAKRVEAQGGSILCAQVRKGDYRDELKAVASDQSPVSSEKLKTGQGSHCDTDSDPRKIAHFERTILAAGYLRQLHEADGAEVEEFCDVCERAAAGGHCRGCSPAPRRR